MRRPSIPKQKSKLSPQDKAIAAARVLIAVAKEGMDDKQAGDFLRETVGLNWSLLTAVQYLTGQEAIAAIQAIRPGEGESGLSKAEIIAALALAHDIAANLHPTSPLSAGLAVKRFKRDKPEP